LVQRVVMPGSEAQSWTLLGDDGSVVEPAERFLAYLAAIERSPNTVWAHAVPEKRSPASATRTPTSKTSSRATSEPNAPADPHPPRINP
jgi:hypothetical protein